MAAKAELIKEFIQRAENAYNNVYTSFQRTAWGVGVVPEPAIADHAFVASQAEGQRYSVEVKGALRIDKLPYRRRASAASRDEENPHSSGIHVLLDSLDIYKFDQDRPSLTNSFLYSSTVRLAYFKEKKRKWKPHLCVRYDFARSFGSHPIFHAQLEDGMPSAEVLTMFPDLPEVVDLMDVHTKVRLPTANVVGATALLSLAADHLPLAKFPDVLRAVRAQDLFNNDPWRCDCSSLDDGSVPRSVLASRWYSTNLEEEP